MLIESQDKGINYGSKAMKIVHSLLLKTMVSLEKRNVFGNAFMLYLLSNYMYKYGIVLCNRNSVG